jgi:hypothetical protein
MPKIKYILPVFVMVLVMGLSNTAFAQLTCNVASTPVSRATDTGLTEPAGDLIFNCVQGAVATTTATLTIQYSGVSITNNAAYPTNKPISIINTSGTLTGGQAPTPLVNANVVNVAPGGGQVVIQIPAQAGAAQAPGSFTLTGVLVALSGTGLANVRATVSASPGNNVLITAGQDTATVITSVSPGLNNPTVTAGPGIILTPGVIIAQNFSVKVQERYIDMFRNQWQFNQTTNATQASTNGVQLLFQFTGIPTGVTVGGCSASSTTGTLIQPATTITSAAPALTVEFGGANAAAGPDLTNQDSVTLSCTTWSNGTATLPFTPGNVQVQVTLAPTGVAFGTGNTVLTGATTGQIPRYTQTLLPTPPLTVITIISATTHMMLPFVSVGNGFDTGFVFANTSSDPYGSAGGGARSNSGTIAVYFFPTSGAPFCLTTGGTATNPIGGGTGATSCAVLSGTNVGLGLTSGGVVAAGASWVVLGSEMFKQITGAPAVFNGYAMAISNFSYGHSTVFVADAAFSGKFTAGGPGLILPNPAVLSRTANVSLPNAGQAEILGH